VDAGKKGLRLSLLSKKRAAEDAAAADGLGGLQPGALVGGVVTAVHTDAADAVTHLTLALDAGGAGAGAGAPAARLDVAHLADHPAAAAALAEAAAVGTRFEGLLVLQRLEVSPGTQRGARLAGSKRLAGGGWRAAGACWRFEI
jgi:rRNA biogenesis protein RRP5